MRPLTTDRMTVSGLGYEDVPRVSSRAEGFGASTRANFRESWPHQALLEVAIHNQAVEQLKGRPEDWARYEADSGRQDRMGFGGRLYAFQPEAGPVTAEKYLPRYTPEELVQMTGAPVPEGIEFEADGKLTLPRYSVYSQAREDQTADQATAAAMPEGVLSGATALAGGLLASVADPLNLVPFGAAISKAGGLAKAGKAARSRILKESVKIGAFEGVAGAMVADVISYPLANRWGADMGLDDALADMAISGALGSVFGALGGVLAIREEKIAQAHQKAFTEAVAALEAGGDVDVADALAPLRDEARREYERLVNDPEEQAGLVAREEALLGESLEAFQAQLDNVASGQWRDSPVVSTSRDGPRLVLGDAPPVLRMLDGGWSSLELPVGLARDLAARKEWAGVDLGDLPRALSRPVAAFEFQGGRRVLLVEIAGRDGVARPALAETWPILKEFYQQRRNALHSDVVSEISGLHLIADEAPKIENLVADVAARATPVFVDRARLGELAGVPEALVSGPIFERSGIRTPEDVPAHLMRESLGPVEDFVNDFAGEGRVAETGARAEGSRREAGEDGGSGEVRSDQPPDGYGPEWQPGGVEVASPSKGQADIDRPVASRLEYDPDGEVDVETSRAKIKKASTAVLNSLGLDSARSGRGRVGARKALPAHAQMGWDAEIGNVEMGKIIKSAETAEDLLAIEAIPELWRTSSHAGSEPWIETKKKGGDSDFYRAVHRFTNTIKIGGETYQVKITIRETKNGRGYYYQKVEKIEEPKKYPGGGASKGPIAPINSGSSGQSITTGGPNVKGDGAGEAAEGGWKALTSKEEAARAQVREAEIARAEKQFAEMAARGELSEAELDDWRGIERDKEGRVVHDEKAADDVEARKAEMLMSATECAVGNMLPEGAPRPRRKR